MISSPSIGLRDDVEHVWKPWYAAGRMTIRGERRKSEVVVTADGAPLDWRSSLAVRNHSPTGPAWGYGGTSSRRSWRTASNLPCNRDRVETHVSSSKYRGMVPT